MSSLGQARASHSTARNYMHVCRLRQLLRFSSFFKSSTSLRKRIIANNALPQLLQRVSALRHDCSYCVEWTAPAIATIATIATIAGAWTTRNCWAANLNASALIFLENMLPFTTVFFGCGGGGKLLRRIYFCRLQRLKGFHQRGCQWAGREAAYKNEKAHTQKNTKPTKPKGGP